MIRLSIFLGALAISANAYAGHSDALDNDDFGRHVILCERLLTQSQLEPKLVELKQHFLGRPFLLNYKAHDMTPLGMEKMGFRGVDPNSRAIQDLVLVAEKSPDKSKLVVTLNRWQSGGFQTVQFFEFPLAGVRAYRAVSLPDGHLSYSFQKLQTEYPDDGSGDHGIAFVDEPDKNGIRRFIAFDTNQSYSDDTSAWVTLGLDVDPDLKVAEAYSEDLIEVTDELRTPQKNWRRIAVLPFARLDGDHDNHLGGDVRNGTL